MRRRAALLTTCALAATLLLAHAPAASDASRTGSASAIGGECVWVKHSKRVVRWVKRGGERRRVTRRKVWWTCRPISSAAPLPSPNPGSEPIPEPEPEPTGPARLGVRAYEFSYVLSRPSIVSGDAIIELNNRGEDPHNLNISRLGSTEAPLSLATTDSLTQVTGRFNLAPGEYRLWCSLPLHESWGMSADLTVTG